MQALVNKISAALRLRNPDTAIRRNAAARLLLCLALAPPAVADTLTGRVIRTTDGDTLTLLDSRFRQHKIRLTGIGAPQSERPFGTVSRQDLADLLLATALFGAWYRRRGRQPPSTERASGSEAGGRYAGSRVLPGLEHLA